MVLALSTLTSAKGLAPYGRQRVKFPQIVDQIFLEMFLKIFLKTNFYFFKNIFKNIFEKIIFDFQKIFFRGRPPGKLSQVLDLAK